MPFDTIYAVIKIVERMKNGDVMENVDKMEWEIKGTRLERYWGISEEIVIPNGVESIDKYAFNDYRRNHYPIKKLTIPGTVKEISDDLFKKMPIEELVLEEGVAYIGSSAFSHSKIKKLTLPSTMKRIGDFAFCDCDLTELILNEEIEEIFFDAFVGNQLTRIVFPKTLPKIQLDNFSFSREEPVDVVCHFRHIGNINTFFNNRDYPITCNFSVIVDNDFNYFAFFDFIRDIKRKKMGMDVKKITLIGYEGLIPKVFVANAGIEIEMIEDKNGLVKKELLGTKTEKKEIVDSNSRDQEIDELVNGIKEKSNILEESLKTNVLSKVDDLVKKYHEDLESLRPKLEKENNITLRMNQTPQSLRINLISELLKIRTNFIDLDTNIYLKEKIKKYKEIVGDDSNVEEQAQVETIEDKIRETKYYASLMNQGNINSEILKILKEIENSLIVPSLDTITLKIHTSSNNPEQELTNRLNNLFDKVREAYIFYQSLRGENDTSLGNDIKDLDVIINFLDTESKKDYQERLDSIKNKYFEEVKDLTIENGSELKIRKELAPILEELSKLVPNMKEKRDVLNDISEAKKVVTLESNENLGAITSAVKDIIAQLESNILDETTKDKIMAFLLQTLGDSYESILNNTFSLEEKEDSLEKNLSWGLKATLKILKEIYSVQNFINEMNKYNEDIKPIVPESEVGNARN